MDRIEVDPREDRFDEDSLWLEVAPEHVSGFTEDVTDKIRDACSEIERRKGYASGSRVPVRSCPK